MTSSRVFVSMWLLFAIIFYIFTEEQVGLIILILTFILLLLLFLNIFLMKNNIKLSVKSSGTIHKNEQGVIYLNVLNRSVIPISKAMVTLQLTNILTMDKKEEIIYTSINTKENKQIPITLQSSLCGSVEVTITSIKFFDFLGFFTRTFDKFVSTNLYVLPNIYDVSLHLSKKDGTIDDDLSLQSDKKGINGLEIFGVREYEPGDNIRHVHWNLSSKFNELIVKEMTEEVAYRFLLLIDFTILIDKQSKTNPVTVDALVEAFISVSKSLLDLGYSHKIGWLDPDDSIIRIETVSDNDKLNLLLRQILSLSQVMTEQTLLEQFTMTEYVKQYSNIVYFTHELETFKHDPTMFSNVHLTTIVCSEKNNDRINYSGEIFSFNPNEIEEQLRMLTI